MEMDYEDEFRQIEEYVSKYIDTNDNRLNEASVELLVEAVIDRQITLLTGSRFLVNLKKENKPLILQAAKESGYRIYVEDEAFQNPLLGELKPLAGMISVYTWDIKRLHLSFWDKYDEIQKRDHMELKNLLG